MLCLAFLDDTAKHFSVKSLGDGLALLLRVFDSLEGTKKIFARIDDFNGNAELAKKSCNPFGLSLAHEAILDKDGLEAIPESPMPKHRNRR
jgi:hypothetical protein